MSDFPQLVVELEFAGKFAETTFVLNTSILGSVPISSGWTDMSDRVRQLDVKRGRQHELDRVESGTLTMTLKNGDRWLDPLYAGSPFYPNITPGRRVRVQAIWNSVTYPLFNGFIERWPPKRTAPTDAEVTVDAVDALAVLEQAELNAVYGENLAGARITQILNDAGWPAADRRIDTGTVLMDDALLEGSGTSALQHALDIGDSELGAVFAAGDGVFVFHDKNRRNTPPYNVSQGTFAAEIEQVVFPEVVGNLVVNPSFENDIGGGWNWTNCTLARVTSQYKFGIACAQLTGTSAAAQYIYVQNVVTGSPIAAGRTFTISMSVKGVPGRTAQIQLNESGGAVGDAAVAAVAVLCTGQWQRITATGSVARADRTNLYLIAYGATDGQVGDVSYIDGVQLNDGAAIPSYVDGDQANCRWSGTKHASTSMYGGQYPYIDISPSYDLDQLYNDVVVTVASDAMPAEVTDAPSIGQFWRRTLSRQVLLANWNDALAQANTLLARYKNATPRVDALTIKPSGLLWPQALGRELGDRITVVDNPAGSGPPTWLDCHVEGVSHSVSGFKWQTNWQLSSAVIP